MTGGRTVKKMVWTEWLKATCFCTLRAERLLSVKSRRRWKKTFNKSMSNFSDGRSTEPLTVQSNPQSIKLSLDATRFTPAKIDRLKTLVAALAKAQVFQKASVQVVHSYTHHEWNHDFTFESLACGKQGYMRGRGGTICRGDYIVLESGLNQTRYQVVEIDYDATASGFWAALLHSCSEVTDRRFWMQPINETCPAAG